jgi:(2Fe-2S) ferredoxin
MDKGAEAAFEHMKARVKKLGLNGQEKVRINRAGCLDRCGEGPLLVVYPQAIWYTFVDNDDIDEIIESHLMNGKVVERLAI